MRQAEGVVCQAPSSAKLAGLRFEMAQTFVREHVSLQGMECHAEVPVQGALGVDGVGLHIESHLEGACKEKQPIW